MVINKNVFINGTFTSKLKIIIICFELTDKFR